ncbi:MAG: hypothetical protein HN509_13830 [Halobacteriovoraceae bacterium]|jgi:hypothetical protein|nr:hypothetical protein [Halobacteriovoraceae bacterium]MBT5093301.1 hypothetical protein [Halobacteriovoraceae bacterium]
MKVFILCLLLWLPGLANSNDDLEALLEIDSVALATAGQHWTDGDNFEGQIVIFEVEGKFYRGAFKGEVTLGAHGLEAYDLSVTVLRKEVVEKLEQDGKLHIVRRGIDYGNIQIAKDKPLAVDNYLEIAPVRVYGTVGWSPSEKSQFEFLAEASLSVGYAHARSTDSSIESTDSFFVGQNYKFSLKHKRYGRLDFERGWDGKLAKYDPESSDSREAWVSLTYTYQLNQSSSVSISAEKRSFRFGPEYEKAKTYMIRYRRKL